MRDQGVSPLIGMILGLGIIVGFIGIVQNFFVPEWVKAEEWDHYEKVSSEFSYLTKVVALSSSTGSPNTATIDMGVEHSSYPFLLTPPDTASFIKTEKLHINVTYYEVYPNGTVAPKPKTLLLNTSAIILKPDYVYLDDVEFIYEHGYAFKRYRNANVTLTDQNMITGDTVNIYIINTTFDSLATTQPLNLVFSPLSYGGVISVANATIRFESLNPGYWESIGANVNGSVVQINVTNARLRIATILVSSGGGSTMATSDISPKLTELLPRSSRLNLMVGETEKVEVMARDQFGNPVTGVTINASVSGDIGNFDGSSATSERTDANGVATFYFTATKDGFGTISFEATGVSPVSIQVEVSRISSEEETTWNPVTNNQATIARAQDVWTGIYGASQIILKNGRSYENDPELEFVIYNSTTAYKFKVKPNKSEENIEISMPDINKDKKEDDKWTLKEPAKDNIFTSTGTDLLDSSNYEKGHGRMHGGNDLSYKLQIIKAFLSNATPSDPVNLAVQKIKGWVVDIQII